MTAPEQITIVTTNPRADKLHDNPELIQQTSPYYAAEDIPPDAIRAFYTSQGLDSSPLRRGWMFLELGMHEPRHLLRAFEIFQTARRTLRGTGNEDTYPDACICLASMPLFADHALRQDPDINTLTTVRTNLLEVLNDSDIPNGVKGQVITMLLGIDQAMDTGDPQYVLRPSSYREGHSVYRNPLGQRLSHDVYQWTPGGKFPIEVKLTNSKWEYADDIYPFHLLPHAHRIIVDQGLYPHHIYGLGGETNSARLLHVIIQAFNDKGDKTSNRHLLQGLQNSLWSDLEAHQQRYPHPGTVQTIHTHVQLAAERSTRLAPLTNIESIEGLALTILAAREELVLPPLYTIEQQLTEALARLHAATDMGGLLANSAEHAIQARVNLRMAIGALAIGYWNLTHYTLAITNAYTSYKGGGKQWARHHPLR